MLNKESTDIEVFVKTFPPEKSTMLIRNKKT